MLVSIRMASQPSLVLYIPAQSSAVREWSCCMVGSCARHNPFVDLPTARVIRFIPHVSCLLEWQCVTLACGNDTMLGTSQRGSLEILRSRMSARAVTYDDQYIDSRGLSFSAYGYLR